MAQDAEKESSILVVDDTPKNIQVLGTTLKEHNYKVKAATNGEEALEAVERSPTDLILLDIMMPVMDGFETCRRLKENSSTQEIPIIFLTAKNDTEDIVKGFELGAVDYITKPFQAAELISRVETHLELKKHRDTMKRINRERKELVHVLCHDLTNPIGFVLSTLEMAKSIPETLCEMRDHMETSMKNSLEIINMVRAMMAIEDRKITLDTGLYQLKWLVEESLAILQRKIDDKELLVDMQISEKLQVKVDKTSFINSVVNNLLTNAAKFSFPGSKIDIRAYENGRQEVEMVIRDYGIGMPGALIQDLFDIKKATSRKGTNGESGTGFGMPLVEKFIHACGGKIEVSSKEKEESPADHGTQVTIILPGSSSLTES